MPLKTHSVFGHRVGSRERSIWQLRRSCVLKRVPCFSAVDVGLECIPRRNREVQRINGNYCDCRMIYRIGTHGRNR